MLYIATYNSYHHVKSYDLGYFSSTVVISEIVCKLTFDIARNIIIILLENNQDSW